MSLFHHYEDTILAKGEMLTMNTWESHLNNNIMLVGASGRGKSRNFIKPNIMQMNSNLVISDPKGEIVLELGEMLRREGYKIKVLNLIDMAHSDMYNPFHYVKSDADIYKMIEYLMVNLDPHFGLGRNGDPFWDDAAKNLLAAICFYLYHECNEEDRTFDNVMKLLRCLEVREDQEGFESTLDIMFRDLADFYPDHIAVKQYKIFKLAAGKTAKSIAVTMGVKLQWFNLKEYIGLTSTDNFELDKLSWEKTALFVIVSDTDRSKNWLAGVFYSQLFDLLCAAENYRHIRFFLDDFACTAKIPDFDYKMAMIRSRNISCVISVQDEAQLIKEYGKAAQGIITNCDSYVFLGATNIDICDTVAHRLGNPRLSGSDLRRMKHEECVVICGNEGGIHKKYDITKHPRYKLMADKGSSAPRYDLNQNHVVRLENNKLGCSRLDELIECAKDPRGKTVERKSSLFDGAEEAYLYSFLCRLSNLHVCIHQHLRDLFTCDATHLSIKLSMMHCDFVVRDNEMNVLFGIEIDGKQHETDEDQYENDRMKDDFFRQTNIPLLRIPAYKVRHRINIVLDSLFDMLEKVSPSEHVLKGETIDYKTFLSQYEQENEAPPQTSDTSDVALSLNEATDDKKEKLKAYNRSDRFNTAEVEKQPPYMERMAARHHKAGCTCRVCSGKKTALLFQSEYDETSDDAANT